MFISRLPSRVCATSDPDGIPARVAHHSAGFECGDPECVSTCQADERCACPKSKGRSWPHGSTHSLPRAHLFEKVQEDLRWLGAGDGNRTVEDEEGYPGRTERLGLLDVGSDGIKIAV